MLYGYNEIMKTAPKKQEMQKVTVMLPRELIERAKRVTGLGLTPILRRGLEAVAATQASAVSVRLRPIYGSTPPMKERSGIA